MSKKTRQAILAYAHEHGEISTAKANELFAKFYYYNGRKHVQDCLSRLVNSGELYRYERGLYKKGRGGKRKPEYKDDAQQTLF